MANGFGPARNFRQRSWPRLREYNTLLKVANPIPASVLDGDRWLAGINFDPVSLDDVECWSPACDEDDDWGVTGSTDADGSTEFVPVELRTTTQCSTIGLDPAELKDRINAQIDAEESSALTGLIVGGQSPSDCWPNRTIGGTGVDDALASLVGGSSQIYALDEAVARLEDQMYRTLGDAMGTIWMPPGMMGLLNKGALVFEAAEQCWYTASGTAIVADGGTTGRGADVEVDESTTLEPGPGDDFEWIYGSGPIWLHRGPRSYSPDVFDQIDGDGLTHLLPRNIVRFMSRRMAIAVFDPATRWRIAAGYASSVFVS